MSCLTTSATRRSRSVPAAVLIASAAASSHEVLLVLMISVTLYTLMTLSFDHVRPAPGRLPPACHRVTLPVRRCRQMIAESAGRVAGTCAFTGDRGAGFSAALAISGISTSGYGFRVLLCASITFGGLAPR